MQTSNLRLVRLKNGGFTPKRMNEERREAFDKLAVIGPGHSPFMEVKNYYEFVKSRIK